MLWQQILVGFAGLALGCAIVVPLLLHARKQDK